MHVLRRIQLADVEVALHCCFRVLHADAGCRVFALGTLLEPDAH